jgi:anhydro-N-acetylmuramic acid kinase
MTVLGLMSGTSFDGLDLCCVSFRKEGAGYAYTIIATYTHEYPAGFVEQLRQAHLLKESELEQLEDAYDQIVLKAISEFSKQLTQPIDLISSHGHTVFHQPERGITRQIGNGITYFNQLNTPVVYDFRTYDVALGGQGAPLVPIGDALLFESYDACLNLGGISNISYTEGGMHRAFDIGMFNTPLNDLVKQMGLAYDEGGKIAASGTLIPDLLEQLNALAFFKREAPKSLGKEWYYKAFFPLISAVEGSIADLSCTVIEHNVDQINRVLAQLVAHKKGKQLRVLVTGGGAHNTFAVNRLRNTVSEQISIEVPEKQLVDYKEALIFAFMGYLRVRNEINVFSSVTGASKDSCAGTLVTSSVE